MTPTETTVQTEAPAAEELEPAAGTIQISQDDGMPMVYVPAGQFSMGSEDGYEDEQPVHTVYLDGYWIDQTEVTNAMYAQCVASGACTVPSDFSSYKRLSYYGNSQYGDYPVIYVNWYQAKDYCQWAGRELPTEAQWEKAARGPDGRAFPWGEAQPAGTLVNFSDRNNDFIWSDDSVDDGFADTAPVASYPDGASPYGALDMAGNVFEWVADWYDSSYYSQSPANNPTGPLSGKYRVRRGGSWDLNVNHIRTANRHWDHPETSTNLGFRCALPVQ